MSKCEGHHHTSGCGLKCVLLCLLFHIHIHSCHDADVDVTAPPGVAGNHSLTEDIRHIANKTGTPPTASIDQPAIDFLTQIFKKYGNGEKISFEGFEHLLRSLKLSHIKFNDHTLQTHRINGSFEKLHQNHNHSSSHDSHDNDQDSHCIPPCHSHSDQHVDDTSPQHQTSDLNHDPHRNRRRVQENGGNHADGQKCVDGPHYLSNYQVTAPLSRAEFQLLCPALVAQIDSSACRHSTQQNPKTGAKKTGVFTVSYTVWGYAVVSVVIISLVGLLCVAVIPLTTKVFYNHLLQFLVALAIGSLTGDACLHLLPHALSPHSHSDSSHSSQESHTGHHHSQEPEVSPHSRAAVYKGLVMLGGIYFFFLMERLMGLLTERKRRSNKKKRENSPTNYKPVHEHESEIGAKLSSHATNITSCEEVLMVVHPSKDIKGMTEDAHDEVHENCNLEDTEQVQGHTWGHGHSHGPLPSSVSSVAYMVIMGDGLHNFSDGLAIGAAYANSLTGGFSTTVAVLCHELPHELGDFAVLLRAGMSPKQAIVYNLVSSVLCFLGMLVGVAVGNLEEASLWIFAVIAGSFVYIALVDMLPELSAVDPKAGENPFLHLLLQNIGLITGASIMLVIAMYEDQIKIPHWEP